MKIIHLALVALPLLLSGCSTLSNVNWSRLSPVNWFAAPPEVSEQGVGGLNGSTAMNEDAVAAALGNQYRLRSGMKTDKGNIVRFYEAMDDDQIMVVVTGKDGMVNRVDVLDKSITTDSGVKLGTPFSEIYTMAYGICHKVNEDDDKQYISCPAKGSNHISYVFSGEWRGPSELIPSDDVLKAWTVSKIVWHR